MADEDLRKTHTLFGRRNRTFLEIISLVGCLILTLNNNIKGSEDTTNFEKIDIPTFNIWNLIFRGSTRYRLLVNRIQNGSI